MERGWIQNKSFFPSSSRAPARVRARSRIKIVKKKFARARAREEGLELPLEAEVGFLGGDGAA